ncbi:C-type lectin domain family 4 member F-like isoform X2 [Hippoglossus hippoglossus]|uniref:C-type lectin domain family 4 member F-like isoform X2 n=1 Tax=Hippoglossus hippoglossus TaxID=8267 RepID=UPI00148CEB48|nr:C-type lectin domain family 4 member F-like isoform X2 [Hippoglossus hippoglossus]
MTVQYHASTVTNMDIEESKIVSKQFFEDGSSRRNSEFVLRNSSYRVATVCLGLLCVLMLAGIIGQSIHYQKVEKEHQDNVKVMDKEKENLQLSQSQLETTNSALNKNIEQLRASKSRLDTNYNVLSAAKELLQKQYDTVVKRKDELQGSHDSVSRERDNLHNKFNNVTRSKEKLQMSYNDLIKDIEHLQERYNASTGEKDTLANSHQSLTTERDTLQETFNSLKKATDILRDNYASLAREKKELESSINKVTAERELLMVKISNLTAERDYLQGLVDKMNKTMQDKKCFNGWQKLECSCYYTSSGKKSWQKSREYCQSKGADLAIITSRNKMVHFSVRIIDQQIKFHLYSPYSQIFLPHRI